MSKNLVRSWIAELHLPGKYLIGSSLNWETPKDHFWKRGSIPPHLCIMQQMPPTFAIYMTLEAQSRDLGKTFQFSLMNLWLEKQEEQEIGVMQTFLQAVYLPSSCHLFRTVVEKWKGGNSIAVRAHKQIFFKKPRSLHNDSGNYQASLGLDWLWLYIGMDSWGFLVAVMEYGLWKGESFNLACTQRDTYIHSWFKTTISR